MANEEQIALLKEGANIWNKWRENNSQTAIDLSDANLSNLDLSGANFSQIQLAKANFYQSNLSNTDFNNSNLSYVNFRGSNLDRANLESANLDYAIFKAAIITTETTIDEKWRTVWSIVNQETLKINLQGKDLSNSNLFGVDFNNTDLSKTNFNKANLNCVNFHRSELRETNLSGANLYKADLSDAYLLGANLQQANLNSANLDGAYLREANLNYAILKAARITQKTIIEQKWRTVWEILNQEDIDRNFRHLDLSKIYFVGVNFEAANLSYADLRASNLCGADLSQVKLDKADLHGAFYDLHTQFPTNFSPQQLGMILRSDRHLSDDTVMFAVQNSPDNSATKKSKTNMFNFGFLKKKFFR
jgi:uncharacterized protein YjbI with pentapeptide repeats